jgi:hypothetical protein
MNCPAEFDRMTNIPSAQGHDTPTSLVDFATTSTVQVEDLTQFERDGFLVARGFFNPTETAQILRWTESDYAGFRAYSADRKLVPVSSEVRSVDPKRNTRVLLREFTQWTGSTI